MKSGVTVARFGPGDALELIWPGRPGTPVDVSSDGRPCLFLHPRSTGGVLVELVQGPRVEG